MRLDADPLRRGREEVRASGGRPRDQPVGAAAVVAGRAARRTEHQVGRLLGRLVPVERDVGLGGSGAARRLLAERGRHQGLQGQVLGLAGGRDEPLVLPVGGDAVVLLRVADGGLDVVQLLRVLGRHHDLRLVDVGDPDVVANIGLPERKKIIVIYLVDPL